MRKSGSAPAVTLEGDGGLPLANFSSISSWLKCGYNYELTTLRQIQPRMIVRAPDLGTAGHMSLEACVRRMTKARKPTKMRTYRAIADAAADQWYKEEVRIRGGLEYLHPDERDLLDEIRESAPLIAVRAIEFINPDRWETVIIRGTPASEFAMMVPFPGWGGFHCTVDWVAIDHEEGGTWLWDYKFRQQFTPIEAEEVNLQMPCYLKVLKEHSGVVCDGSIMFQARSQVPKVPQLNKNGTMSRSAIRSDWPTYKKALIDAGLDPADYEEMKAKLEEAEFFRLERDYRSDAEIENVWNQIMIPASKAMLEDKIYVRRMYHMNCNGCKSRDFCLAELHGEDTDLLLQTSYIDHNNPQPRLMIRPEDALLEG